MNRSTREEYAARGWIKFPVDPRLRSWLAAAAPAAFEVAAAPDVRRKWLRHGDTWLVGVSGLPNHEDGSIGGSGPLSCDATDFIEEIQGDFAWDRAQVSVCFRGYPRRDAHESVNAHRYRMDRDAAHVDGLHPVGTRRRRHLRESHRFVLGIPVNESPAKAAPFVVWDGSHEVMRNVFQEEFGPLEPDQWSGVDVTDVYHDARRSIWADCARHELPARPGEAYLVHRFALHGMAPWPGTLNGPREGRVILYFRPPFPLDRAWLNDP